MRKREKPRGGCARRASRSARAPLRCGHGDWRRAAPKLPACSSLDSDNAAWGPPSRLRGVRPGRRSRSKGNELGNSATMLLKINEFKEKQKKLKISLDKKVEIGVHSLL